MKRHPVLLTIISTLLLSNIVITHSFYQNSNEYEQKLKEKDRILAFRQSFVREKQDKIDVLMEQIQEKDLQIKKQNSTIHNLKKQLEKAKKRNESPTITISRGAQPSPKINMIATAYVSFCTGCIGITKAEVDVRKSIYHKGMRVIAVDPRIIPLHSIVKVHTKNESFLAYAADTGNAIKGYKIDVLIDTHNEQKAFDFGVQNVQVQILREGKG